MYNSAWTSLEAWFPANAQNKAAIACGPKVGDGVKVLRRLMLSDAKYADVAEIVVINGAATGCRGYVGTKNLKSSREAPYPRPDTILGRPGGVQPPE
jgi:hypothetical protein